MAAAAATLVRLAEVWSRRPAARIGSAAMATYDDSLASVDGAIMPALEARIPVTDEGLLRGDGVFEAVRVYAGTPFRWRTISPAWSARPGICACPWTWRPSGPTCGGCWPRPGPAPTPRLRHCASCVTRGGRRVLLTEPLPELADRARLGTVSYAPTRVLDGVKSLSYASNMLARRLAQEAGFDEALLVTPHGRVLEAPTSSVFWVKDGDLHTPPLSDHILASITRQLVIDVTGAGERETTLEDLLAADEVFLASTMREVHPVGTVDDREYPADAPVTAGAAEAVGRRVAEELAGA